MSRWVFSPSSGVTRRFAHSNPYSDSPNVPKNQSCHPGGRGGCVCCRAWSMAMGWGRENLKLKESSEFELHFTFVAMCSRIGLSKFSKTQKGHSRCGCPALSRGCIHKTTRKLYLAITQTTDFDRRFTSSSNGTFSVFNPTASLAPGTVSNSVTARALLTAKLKPWGSCPVLRRL